MLRAHAEQSYDLRSVHLRMILDNAAATSVGENGIVYEEHDEAQVVDPFLTISEGEAIALRDALVRLYPLVSDGVPRADFDREAQRVDKLQDALIDTLTRMDI